jgi:hypothetical protein
LIAPAIAEAFSALQFDLSFLLVDKDCDNIISSLIDLLKLDGSRENSCPISQALAKQSSDPAATKRLLLSLSELFSKKGLVPPHQRLVHASVLSAVVSCRPADIAKHAAEIAPDIAAATARENNDDALSAMLALCVQVSAYAGFFDENGAKAAAYECIDSAESLAGPYGLQRKISGRTSCSFYSAFSICYRERRHKARLSRRRRSSTYCSL